MPKNITKSKRIISPRSHSVCLAQLRNILLKSVENIGAGVTIAVRHQRAYMLVLAVAVSHSPTSAMMSNPVDSWLKNLG